MCQLFLAQRWMVSMHSYEAKTIQFSKNNSFTNCLDDDNKMRCYNAMLEVLKMAVFFDHTGKNILNITSICLFLSVANIYPCLAVKHYGFLNCCLLHSLGIPVCDFSARDFDLRPFVLHADVLVFAGGSVDVVLVESCYDGVMPEAGGAPPAAGLGVEAVLAARRG